MSVCVFSFFQIYFISNFIILLLLSNFFFIFIFFWFDMDGFFTPDFSIEDAPILSTFTPEFLFVEQPTIPNTDDGTALVDPSTVIRIAITLLKQFKKYSRLPKTHTARLSEQETTQHVKDLASLFIRAQSTGMVIQKNDGSMGYCEHLHLIHDALVNANTYVVCRRAEPKRSKIGTA